MPVSWIFFSTFHPFGVQGNRDGIAARGEKPPDFALEFGRAFHGTVDCARFVDSLLHFSFFGRVGSCRKIGMGSLHAVKNHLILRWNLVALSTER